MPIIGQPGRELTQLGRIWRKLGKDAPHDLYKSASSDSNGCSDFAVESRAVFNLVKTGLRFSLRHL